MGYVVKYEDLGSRDYKEVWDYQTMIFNRLLEDKKNGSANGTQLPGTLIFVEHPHVYTLGKSGSESNLLLSHLQLKAKDAAFYRIDRGGDITYHGPGQLVGYPVFDLDRLHCGLKEYINNLEESVIMAMKDFGLESARLQGATGVWVDPLVQGRARKICAIGVRASRHVTMHGFALNISTSLEYFGYINPCGFVDKGVTSLSNETGKNISMAEVKEVVRKKIEKVFGLEWI